MVNTRRNAREQEVSHKDRPSQRKRRNVNPTNVEAPSSSVRREKARHATEYSVEDGTTPDITILAGETAAFNVHAKVISDASPVFAAMLMGDFEATTEEETINLTHLSPNLVRCMLDHIYTSTYDIHTLGPTKILRSARANLIEHSKLYALGDEYDIPTLKDTARDRFSISAERDWSFDIQHFLVLEVYTSTTPSDRGLRDIVLQACEPHVERILTDDRHVRLMDELEDFRHDVMRSAAAKFGRDREEKRAVREQLEVLRGRLNGCEDVVDALLRGEDGGGRRVGVNERDGMAEDEEEGISVEK